MNDGTTGGTIGRTSEVPSVWPLKIANGYGKFDLVHGKLPRGYVHVRGRVHATAKKLRIKYIPAVVDFRTGRYGSSPVTDGIVCTKRSALKLHEALKPKRERERQQIIASEITRLGDAVASACSAAIRYPTPESALVDACEALFVLNRLAKVYPWLRDDIYPVKNGLLRKLVESGYLVAAGKHVVHLASQECYRCEGDGCDRCDDSGYWRESAERHYHVLRFDVFGKSYTWHQPTEGVDYGLPPVPKLDDAGDWDPRERKPVPELVDVRGAIALVTYAAHVSDGDSHSPNDDQT